MSIVFEFIVPRIDPSFRDPATPIKRKIITYFIYHEIYNQIFTYLKAKYPFLDIDNLLKQYDLGDRKPILLGKYLFIS